MGFFDLPRDGDALDHVVKAGAAVRGSFRDLVVLGIGGSGLGAVTLREALLGPHWNASSDEERRGHPRLHVLDNADPATVGGLLARLDPRRTLFNVVSKSGSTAETMAQFLVAEGWLAEALGADDLWDHFLFTTDPERGALRDLANRHGVSTLAVPANVGGRFSVLAPVGLFPAAACGVDVASLLRGAAAMEERCAATALVDNPAGLLATLLHAAHTERGANIHVLMPYSDRLRALTLWFQQLWAESLGKAFDLEGREVNVGPTPLPAVGATDQHAQVQLFMEGPRDKVVVFLAVRDPGTDLDIPSLHGDVDQLGYLGGHTLARLLEAERLATTEALRRRGRLNMTLEVEVVDAEALGALFMLLQVSTVFAAALYGVDALDQPGVELGKDLTYGLLGRSGFDRPEGMDLTAGTAPSPWRV
jgi:glucose-6-phosphate isomerase